MSQDWSAFPVNAVYIKNMRWKKLPKKYRKLIPKSKSIFFVVFNRDGKPVMVSDQATHVVIAMRENGGLEFPVH